MQTAELLVVAPNWLGDLVMSTVLLEHLDDLRHVPGNRPFNITLAVRERWLPLVVDDPRIDRVMPVSRTGRHRGLRGLPALVRQWAAVDFDAAILLPPSLRVALAATLAGIPRRIGYRVDGRGPLLTDSLARPSRGSKHYTLECGALAEVWGRDVYELGDPRPRRLMPDLPACRNMPAPTGVDGDGPPLWVLAVGATYGEAKAWPAANTADFLQKAVGDAGARVLLMGDAAAAGQAGVLKDMVDLPWRREISGGPGVIDLLGRTDLATVVGLLKVAQVFVGNDSGLMHLAAALQVSTIGLFGSSDPDWTAPRGRRARALVAEGFECRPCFRRTCNRETFCLAAISAERVLENVMEMLTPGKDAQ